eukprot:SAG31_NODE_10590_length_1120_cov_1.656219_1_plen_191_part_10
MAISGSVTGRHFSELFNRIQVELRPDLKPRPVIAASEICEWLSAQNIALTVDEMEIFMSEDKLESDVQGASVVLEEMSLRDFNIVMGRLAGMRDYDGNTFHSDELLSQIPRKISAEFYQVDEELKQCIRTSVHELIRKQNARRLWKYAFRCICYSLSSRSQSVGFYKRVLKNINRNKYKTLWKLWLDSHEN